MCSVLINPFGDDYLVYDSGYEGVLAHGGVLVEVAGALISTLVLPQQAGQVDHRAKRYGPGDAT